MAGITAEVKKFPYDVTRRARARKLRWSKNGSPERRAKRKQIIARGGASTRMRIAEHREAAVFRFDEYVSAYCVAKTAGAPRARLAELDEASTAASAEMFKAAT
ncbi:hypothetical protein [Bradyrhizobium neotropicale]|uniref:hypothetical protein n=1 Tax=Bradyrhizobium neotropicale TaxID=1497615 RepID=UPI0011AB8D6D|nr:hypothetical protein [Bradyrhizobium neotropicale]